MKAFGNEFTIDGVVEHVLPNGMDCWVVRLKKPDGGIIPHLFPKFAIEQRIAEYDLDPMDIAGALDSLLHEPWVADPLEPQNHADDPAAKQGMTTAALRARGSVKVGHQVPVHLSNAKDRATAREAHLHRIAEVKGRISINSGQGVGMLTKGDTTDPLQHIVDNHGVTEEGLTARTQYVEWMLRVQHGAIEPEGQMKVTKPGAHPVSSHRPSPRQPRDESLSKRSMTVSIPDNLRE